MDWNNHWHEYSDLYIALGASSALFGICAAGIVFLANAAQAEQEAAWQQFRAECVQDRKEYECLAMWRAGNPKIEVVSVPVVIPVRR